jgi:PAS domain S-box-containing protein
MSSQLRNTGVGLVGSLPWGSHFCYYYDRPADLFRVNVSFLATGLANHELCTLLHPGSDYRGIDQFLQALGRTVPDLETRMAHGELEVIAHEELFLRGSSIDLDRALRRVTERADEAVSRGYDGLRWSGNGAWLQERAPGKSEAFERLLDRVVARKPMLLMCTYPLPAADKPKVVKSIRGHQFALADTMGQAAARADIERALDDTRAFAEALVNSIDGIIVEVDADTFKAKFVSRPIERILGYPPERWLSDPSFWVEHIHPEDRDLAFREKVEAARHRQELKSEYRMVAADGRAVWLRDIVSVHPAGYGAVMRAVMVDITDHKVAEEQLRIANERLRALSAKLELAREEEGARIARELHDELGSALSTLKWQIEDLDRAIAEVREDVGIELHERITGMSHQVDELIATVRRISSELRPTILDDLGVVAALGYQAQQFEDRTGIRCRFDTVVDDLDISREASTAVFRIVQEGLTNVLRHSGATEVSITVEEDDKGAVVEVRDNGRGIQETDAAGLQSSGLMGMRERAELVGGTVKVAGAPGKGTMIKLRVPFNHQHR